jgi:hypothetical protein
MRIAHPICLVDVLKLTGENRQWIVIDAQRLPPTSVMLFSVVFAPGQRAEYFPWDRTLFRPASPIIDPVIA